MDWNKDFDQRHLLGLLNKIKQKPEETKGMFVSIHGASVSFHGGPVYSDLISLLLTAANFRIDIPHDSKERIFNIALYQIAASGDLTPERLRSEISKQEQMFEDTPSSSYTIWSSLSIKHRDDFRLIRLGNQTITFYNEWPKRIVNSHSWDRVREATGGEAPIEFTPIRVRVTARDGFEAIHKAFEFIDLVRGIWNFVLNRSQTWRMTFIASPINKIRPGPGHFIEHKSDPLAGHYWYELSFFWPSKAYDVKNNWPALRSQELRLRRKLSRLPYQAEVESAFRQYVRALDEHDKTTAFLKLWPVLERLTDVSRQRRIDYDILVKRAAYLWPEYKYHKQVLNHLRLVRNRTVHSGIGVSESDHILFQLKRYVESLILYHLNYGYRFLNITEAAAILDHPASNEALQSRIDKAKFSIRLREKVEKRRVPRSTSE